MSQRLLFIFFSLMLFSCSSSQRKNESQTEKREPAQVSQAISLAQIVRQLPFSFPENCLERIPTDSDPFLMMSVSRVGRSGLLPPRAGDLIWNRGISNAGTAMYFLVRQHCRADWSRRARVQLSVRRPVPLIEFHASTPRSFCEVPAVRLACEAESPSRGSEFYRLDRGPPSQAQELQMVFAQAADQSMDFGARFFQKLVFFVVEGQTPTRFSAPDLFLLRAYSKNDTQNRNRIREVWSLSYALRIADSEFSNPNPTASGTPQTVAQVMVNVVNRLYDRPYLQPSGPSRRTAWYFDSSLGRSGYLDPVQYFMYGADHHASLLSERWAFQRQDPVHSGLFSRWAAQERPLSVFSPPFLGPDAPNPINAGLSASAWREAQDWLRAYGDETLLAMSRILATDEDPYRLREAASRWWGARKLLLSMGCGERSRLFSRGNQQEIVYTQYRAQACRRLYVERFVHMLSRQIETTSVFYLDDPIVLPVLAMSSRKERADLFIHFMDLLRQRLQRGPALSPVELNILGYEAVQVNDEIRQNKVLPWTGPEEADQEDLEKLNLLLSRFREFFITRPASRDPDFRIAGIWLSGLFDPSQNTVPTATSTPMPASRQNQ